MKRPLSPESRFLPRFPLSLVNCFTLTPEIREIVLQNSQNLLSITVANCLLYFIGHTMRGMAMSLVNRPFLTSESLYGESNAMEDSKCDTQVLINKRILAMRERFSMLFLTSDPLRSCLFEVVMLLLRSGSMFSLDLCVESRKAVQMLFPFLIALLPLLSARRDGLFLISVFEEVLRLYLTVHQERCVDSVSIEVFCRRKSHIAV